MGCCRNGAGSWCRKHRHFVSVSSCRKSRCAGAGSQRNHEAAVIEAPTETETESVWIPTLDELNLAHYFPEGEEDTRHHQKPGRTRIPRADDRVMQTGPAPSTAIRMSHLRIWQRSLAFPENGFLENITRKTKPSKRKSIYLDHRQLPQRKDPGSGRRRP